MHRATVAVSLAALLLACTKSESGGPTESTSSTVATTTAAATASAAPSASASAEPAASAPASASASASASAAAPAGDAAKAAGNGEGECGKKPLPDCPLQGWMKANMNPPALAGDTAALAVALEKASTFAPPGYTNWASISKDGAKAAKAGDLAAAKASCRSCHDQYKKKYKDELRTRKI